MDIGVFPLEWLDGLLVEPDVTHDFALEIRHRGEDTAIDHVPLQLADPTLDLIEARRIGRGEVELHCGVLLEELIHLRRAVRREVIENHCTSRSAGCVTTISSSNATNSWLVWRAAV